MSATRCPGPCHAELTTGRSCRSGECAKAPSPEMKALYDKMKDMAKDVVFIVGRSEGKSAATDVEVYNALFPVNKGKGFMTIESKPRHGLQTQNYIITDFNKIDLSLK